ncbi:uncharacterized protein [Coffea arabica]|uniref:Uncharacterized protein n=1 Tax=Coffea arabica TaxID=13443 RepID=A0A6P6WSA1_COFAR
MMQSRLAAAAASKVHRLLVSAAISQDHQVFPPAAAPGRLASSISGGGRTADPAIHAVKPEEKAKAASSTNQSEFKPAATKDEDPYVPPKSPCYPSSSPQIQSTGVNQPREPIIQQKRYCTSTTSSSPAPVTQSTEAVSCAGLDGSPWPPEGKQEGEDDKAYFEHHKASPLSELKMVDTRKPITRATDGTAGNNQGGYYGGTGVIVWRPEQLDTAEDSLSRATEIWKSNAMRGDPDSPHGRILRVLRGELCVYEHDN